MENSGGIQASLSGRYALALFELARERDFIKTVEGDLATLKQALTESDDFAALIRNPRVTREAAGKVLATVAKTLGLGEIATNFVGVLAANGRLSALPDVIRAFSAIAAAHRGEVTAEVTSAHALSETQVAALTAQLKAREGRDVKVETRIDPAILGGLVVRLGSKMIDSSIRTRLNTLAQAMKG